MRRSAVVLLLLLCAAALTAAPPGVIAIRDARIVPVNGPVIEKGTVVIRDGLIESAGAQVQAPADAWIVEGRGLTVYPGLIDAVSTVGLPDHAPQEGAPSRRGGGAPAQPATPGAPQPPSARGPEDRPSNTSWLRAADILNLTDKRIESMRNLGFTTAVTFPTKGIFAGQGAVINLAGEKAGQMVVASPAGLYLTTSSAGSGSFPGSLMGVLAYIRQVSIDADHHRLEKALYSKQPSGHRRPAYDRAVEGVLESPRLLLPAKTSVEIDRMIRYAAELNRPAVLYGGYGAYALTDALKAAKLPVAVSLKWPEREKEADPEDEDSLRTLEYRDKAPGAPAALAKAGVPFALYPDNITVERDLKKAVKRALDAGLAHADLVRAMTLRAAEMYGVQDRLGSIEPGKIANLVVTDGDLFAEKTKVKYVFVDGVKFEPLPEAADEKKEEAK